MEGPPDARRPKDLPPRNYRNGVVLPRHGKGDV